MVVAVAMIGVLAFEGAFNTTIDYQMATNARNNMIAELHMRSGANLGRMLIRLQTDVLDKNRQYIGDIQIGDYTGLFMSAFGGSREEVDALAQMMGGISGREMQALGVSVGQFDLQITTEDGKINLNCANGSATTKDNLKAQLEQLVFLQAYDPVFQAESADGWRRTRIEQVAAIMDYIDRDNLRADAEGQPEQYDYQSRSDKYFAKNNYIDSLGETNQIRGVDDRFWTLFGSGLTVYGGCKVNLGALRDPKQIAALIALSAKNPEDPVVRDPNRLWRLAQFVAEA
ncbi:MAG: general secretion pathway protein GspK, partial [Deltaproteobacteria bacterium]|nr:general secretion pathway protein GspK [Deltaproteobacteria bacterium]